uniref:Heme transporter hrg-1 n=1 Tax=Parascaris univalens TaxID=6257 RepID=A0A915AHI5_PARUN
MCQKSRLLKLSKILQRYLILELEYHNVGVVKFGGRNLSVMCAFTLQEGIFRLLLTKNYSAFVCC